SGDHALYSNSNGYYNTATGAQALYNNTGQNNTASGYFALGNNITGNNNIALGYLAGQSLSAGYNNTELGNTGVVYEYGTIRLVTVGTDSAPFIAGISGVTVTNPFPPLSLAPMGD